MFNRSNTELSEVVNLLNIASNESKQENLNKYHDFECCEWTRGIDTLLFRYKQDRDEVTSLILNDPDKLIRTIWKQDGPLAIDNNCRCRMGTGDKRSPFACAQCKNLRRIIDFRLGGVEKTFQIECGDSAGKKLIVSSTEVSSPFLNWDDDSARRAKNYIRQYHNLTICGTPSINNMRSITGDSFTIRTLLMWMITKLFEEKGLPHSPTMYTAFICSGIGYSLYDMPDIGTISELHKIESYHEIDPTINTMKSQHFAYMPLKSYIARTIIIQLLVTLSELSTINFSHGTPSIHGLIFTKDPVSYIYNDFHVEGPITLKITDMWNSSATFNNIHYFPKNIKSSMFIERNMFIPEIATKKVSMAHCYDIGAIQQSESFSTKSGNLKPPLPIVCPANITTCPNATTYDLCKSRNVTLYRLTNSTLDIYSAIRSIGFPLFVGSFDFYCFMIALMCDKSFFEAVIKDDKLYRLWSMMWLIEDLPNIEKLIKDAHEIEARGETPLSNRAASNIVITIIRGAWLRCDITQFLWSLIKLGW